MEEPSGLIRWVTYFFASGHSATCGAVGIASILLLALRPGKVRAPRASLIAIVVLISSFLIVCGSSPVPSWYGLLTAAWGALLVVYWLRHRFHPKSEGLKPDALEGTNDLPFPDRRSRLPWRFNRLSHRLILASPVVWLMIGLAIEVPYQIWRPFSGTVSHLLVIGDSVTAGLNDGELTWPKILPRDVKIEVLDASQPGATLQSARQQNDLFAQKAGVILLEIGGNDLLEGMPVEQFEKNLDRLLSEVNQSDRTIVMFELPLPPLCARYGMIQRRLARRYHVALIPKRYFAQVLTTRGATVDGIHLSASGQAQMAHLIASLFATNFKTGSGTYQHLGR